MPAVKTLESRKTRTRSPDSVTLAPPRSAFAPPGNEAESTLFGIRPPKLSRVRRKALQDTYGGGTRIASRGTIPHMQKEFYGVLRFVGCNHLRLVKRGKLQAFGAEWENARIQ